MQEHSCLYRQYQRNVCDYELRGNLKTGIDIIGYIRENNSYCKVLFYTGLLDTIAKEELIQLLHYNNCRFVERNDIDNEISEEIEEGITLLSIIDRWLIYYNRDDFQFTDMGDDFNEMTSNEIAHEVRCQSRKGIEFVRKLTRIMLTLLSD